MGPQLLVSAHGLPATGLVTPESLVDYTYRIALKNAGNDPAQSRTAIAGFRARAQAAFPDAGWNIRDRTDAAPGIKRFVEQLTMFLTLVGLVALGVGGVGAGQAILAFLDRKRADIAILKTLGASGGFVFLVFFLQVMTVALLATLLGAALGAALPFAAVWIYGAKLPVPPSFGLYPVPLLLALAFGLLSAVAFAVPPLVARPRRAARQPVPRSGRARQGRRAEFLSRHFGRRRHRHRRAHPAGRASPVFAAEFLAGAVAVAGAAAAAGGRLAPRSDCRPAPLALAPAAPGADQSGAARRGHRRRGDRAGAGPHFAGHRHAAERHHQRAGRAAPCRRARPASSSSISSPMKRRASITSSPAFPAPVDYKRTPMIRGRITALNGVPSAEAKVAPDAKWALERRPRHHLCRHAAARHRHHRGPMVAAQL